MVYSVVSTQYTTSTAVAFRLESRSLLTATGMSELSLASVGLDGNTNQAKSSLTDHRASKRYNINQLDILQEKP